jgi:hypothetical protein
VLWKRDPGVAGQPHDVREDPRGAIAKGISLVYTVDVLLPLTDLGYTKRVATGAAQILTVVLVVLGLVLATAVMAAFAGVPPRGLSASIFGPPTGPAFRATWINAPRGEKLIEAIKRLVPI